MSDGNPVQSIGIVGMACVFPGAPDLETYWRNLRTGVDAIGEVPAARWDPVFYDPASSASDRFYCRRGGFIDAYASFDATGFGIMPVAARGAEPDQLLALQVAARALADAGYEDRPFARERAGVILGRGGYAGPGRTRLEQHVRGGEQLAAVLRSLLPDLAEAEIARVKHEFQAQLGAPAADAAIGLVPNLAASRIAQRLDLHGPAFTIDAACASALVAVDQACLELASGRCDLVLCGGVHLCHDEAFWSVFCQLGALSRAETIRPFDRRADGLLIGEGIGIVALKRLDDALRDDDRVYAVIRGTGTASDGRGASLMSPSTDGQVLAVERAWRAAGLDPATVGLLEAHGTATPAGDAAELATVARVFGEAGAGEERAVIGSVKSMIGHTMPAAGAAGLIKAALAIHHGILLPTLHCDEPHEGLASTRFRTIAREEAWARGVTPRRAGVNAFGFGGIDAHVVLEEAPHRSLATTATAREAESPIEERIARYSAPTAGALLADLAAGRERIDGGPARLVLIDPTPERAARARTIVERGRPWRGREGVFFSPRGLVAEGGSVAFVFPGVDASFEPRVDDVARHLGIAPPPRVDPSDLEQLGAGIVAVNRMLDRALRELGVAPTDIAGHSIGEWSGMIATGIIPEAALEAFLATVVPGSLKVPGVVFAAAGCGVDRARAALEGLAEIAISHDNCPHQILFCGREASVDVALARLREDGILGQKLAFQSGFHSPLFAPFVEPHRKNFADLPLESPRATLWSATTCTPYPRAPDAIRELSVRHLLEPVRFRETIEALWTNGTRVFIQAGTGSLVNFVEDTLRGRPHLAISANVKDRSGLAQLRRVLAALFVEGAPVDPGKLGARVRQPLTLALGVPLVRNITPLAARPSPSAPRPSPSAHPLAAEFASVMRAVEGAQDEIFELLASKRPATTARPTATQPERGPREVTTTITLSVETMPALVDHTFFRQPPGWRVISDRHPVVPMTTSIDLMIEHALAAVPGKVAVGVEDVRAFRWLVVSTPVEARITCRFDGKDRVQVTIADASEGTVILADRYPTAPPADVASLEAEAPSATSARSMYDDRWMFHGPAYQGIVEMGMVGRDGIRGTLETGAARGALLDNAGQLFGYWVMVQNETNRMAMPVRIGRMRLFGPHPHAGERLACTVRIRSQDERSVVADLTLADRTGHVWAAISGWEDRRFDTDPRLWDVLQWPEKHLLGDKREDGFVVFDDRYRSAPTRDQLARRYLGEGERRDYEKQGPRRQRSWLNGRIAAKDAVRDLLWSLGHPPLFPVELVLHNEESGRPVVRTPSGRDVRVSIAHSEDVAVAIAREGADVGVDIERIRPRGPEFAELALGPDELRLVESEPTDEGWTRLWAAKEAAAKAKGTGLGGNPRRFAVRDRAGERLLVDDSSGRTIWVETKRRGDFILAWTRP
jgi:acyl transferase domain-containing protein/phosphopantetheinyl transferase